MLGRRPFLVLLLIFIFWSVWNFLSPYLSKQIQGYLIVVHAMVVMGIGVYILRQFVSRAVSQVLFGISYLLFGLSDLLWAMNYFVSPAGVKGTLAVATTLICSLSFLFSSLALGFSPREPLEEVPMLQLWV